MKFRRSGIKEFAILSVTPGKVGGAFFKRNGEKFIMQTRVMKHSNADERISDLCRKVFHELNCGSETLRIVAGNIPGDIFFQCRTGKVAQKYMREALSMELALNVPGDTENLAFQFVRAGIPEEDGKEERVSVYAFPAAGLRKLELLIAGSIRKADCFLYPFIGLSPEDPALYLPDLEEDFFFEAGEWHPVSEYDSVSSLALWKKKIESVIELPQEKDFSLEEYLGILVCALFAASERLREEKHGLNILSQKLHPSRYRTQLCITFTLLFLLIGFWGWGAFGSLHQEQKKYKKIQAEFNSLQRQVTNAKFKIKSTEKEVRELTRVLGSTAGEHDLIAELAKLSSALPKNVMIMSFRLGDSSIDITLQSEAESLNIPNQLKSLSRWKVASVRQFRKGNDAGSTIMLKLELAGTSEP